MRSILCVLFIVLFTGTFCAAEDILVAFHTTDSKLVVLKVNFANNKYTIVDRAVFNLTSAGGLTALAPLQGGNYQLAWNQRDTTNKIKAFSMTLGSGLDAIGSTKKYGPALTSFFNFNILPDQDQFSIDFANSVMLRSRASNGNMGGSQGKLFNIPPGFDPIDTSFGRRPVVANNRNNPTVGDEEFFSLGYVIARDEYAFAIYGETLDNPLFGLFLSEVVSVDLIDAFLDPDPENFFFLMFVERLASETNSPSAATRVVLKAQKIDRQTARPVGNSVILVPAKQADLLGTVVFFNMFTTAIEQTAVSTNNAKATGGAHVFYVEQTNACRSTSLKAFHFNAETGKKNSGFSTLLGCSDPIIQPGSKFVYGLSAIVIPGS